MQVSINEINRLQENENGNFNCRYREKIIVVDHRTMPVKFSLRIVPEVDPTQPFVVNNELEIRIYNENTGEMTTSTYGDESANYRIDLEGEIYITNYKTDKILAKYRVKIWRPSNGFKIGEFGFETVK